MFRVNRGRVVGLLLTGFIVYFLFLSSANHDSDFRRRTEEGLSRRHGILQGDLSDEAFRAQTNQKLNDILAKKEDQRIMRASDEGTGPAPIPGQDQYREDADDKVTGVAGRKTMQKPKDKPKYPVDKSHEKQEGLKQSTDDEDDDSEKKGSKDPGKDLAREKLQEYMKKPLIIFSKSYCPHSKKAKHLLLDLYKIVPAPLVVELDQLTEKVPLPADTPKGDDEDKPEAPTLGQKLQELLNEITGRRTVPNIMVGTTSIGGNDLIWEMHEEGSLAPKIRELGGKRITSVDVVEDMDDTKEKKGSH